MTIQDVRIPQAQVTASLVALNNDYHERKLTRKSYLSKHSKARNVNSFANCLKRYGAKVTKVDVGYKFVGRHVTGEIFLDACETEYWTIYEGADGTSDAVDAWCFDIDNCNQFDTKTDAIHQLYLIDVAIEQLH
tara:strand:+ start:292 stop:693 length:402 start_codon:yes stop_codon:yes gene_type:complete